MKKWYKIEVYYKGTLKVESTSFYRHRKDCKNAIIVLQQRPYAHNYIIVCTKCYCDAPYNIGMTAGYAL